MSVHVFLRDYDITFIMGRAHIGFVDASVNVEHCGPSLSKQRRAASFG